MDQLETVYGHDAQIQGGDGEFLQNIKMLPTTLKLVRAAFGADPSISPADRKRLILMLRNGTEGPPKSDGSPKILRRLEAANRLGCSLRTFDQLCKDGHLQKKKLPGRTRSSGVLESDVNALIGATTMLAPTAPANGIA